MILETLVAGVDPLVHADPAPNLIPATFERLSNNVTPQLGNHYLWVLGKASARVGTSSADLRARAALLRAPHVKHIILEDWLLEQDAA